MTQYGNDVPSPAPDVYEITMTLIGNEDPAQAPRNLVENAIKAWRETRQKRLDLDKEVEKIKSFETAMKNWIILALQNQAIEAMVVDGRMTSVNIKDQWTVEDKPALSTYILTTGQLDLLQFRLSKTAIDERIAEGMEIPGLGSIPVYELSDKKAK